MLPARSTRDHFSTSLWRKARYCSLLPASGVTARFVSRSRRSGLANALAAAWFKVRMTSGGVPVTALLLMAIPSVIVSAFYAYQPSFVQLTYDATLVIATHDARVQAALPQALTLHLLAPERATLAQDGVSA